MDDIVLQSELEAKRIRQGLCPRCGYVVNKIGTLGTGVTGKSAFFYREVRCTKCSFHIGENDVWDQKEGYCIQRGPQ